MERVLYDDMPIYAIVQYAGSIVLALIMTAVIINNQKIRQFIMMETWKAD